MSNPSKPFVVAVAAVSGGGKTTVVRALQEKLVSIAQSTVQYLMPAII